MNSWAFNVLNAEIETADFAAYGTWGVILQVGVILCAIMVSNIIRRKVKFIRNTLLPTSIIAGMLILALKFIPGVNLFIRTEFMETLTYHCLGLGFIAMTLKSAVKSKDTNKRTVFFTGITTVNGYLVQAILGLGISILLGMTFFKDLYFGAGLLLPMGFGQGTGQALNIGSVLEKSGFEQGKTFGLAVAAIGFLVACTCGVIYLNYLKKKGRLAKHMERKEVSNTLNTDIYAPDEAPLSEAVDKLTMQFGFVLLVYLMTYGAMAGLSWLSETYFGDFGVNTLKPLFWGFNFLFGSLFAIIIKKAIVLLRKKKIMNHTYINDYMMSRLSGFFFDVMIVAGIAAIDWHNLSGLLWPLLIICLFGGVGTFFYIKFMSKKLYKNYEYEGFFSMFGMLTGTASMGMILLREIDPNYETPAADNLVLQQFPAILFGAPILFLIPIAGRSLTNALIILPCVVGMFIIYNLIVLWRHIFKKK